jgi:plasmid stability protein
MTLTIELPDEQTAALSAKARAQGLSAEEYARQVLQHDLAPEWLQKSWENTKEAGLDRLSMEEIDAEIARPGKPGANPDCNRAHDPGRSRHQHNRLGVAPAPWTVRTGVPVRARRLNRLCVSGNIYAE